MKMFRNEFSLKKQYKALKDIPDEVLYDFLQNNENVPVNLLACVCSEVLRRMFKEKYGSKNE